MFSDEILSFIKFKLTARFLQAYEPGLYIKTLISKKKSFTILKKSLKAFMLHFLVAKTSFNKITFCM
jgi:hypothetical protein